MNLNLYQRMNQNQTNLPVELVEDIIDKVLADYHYSWTIYNIRRTSHLFRTIINKKRFRAIKLGRNNDPYADETGKKLKKFAELIRNGSAVGTMPGVCDFITSFSLNMTGYYEDVTKVIEDGSLACILNYLFRSNTIHNVSTERTFSLRIERWPRHGNPQYVNDDQESPKFGGLSLNSISKDLSTALQDLVQLSYLNRLKLQGMLTVPQDFLLGSNVKHLSLQQSLIKTGLYLDKETAMAKKLPDVESLEIDSFAVNEDIDFVTNPIMLARGLPDYCFSQLVHLNICLPNFESLIAMNEILKRSPALKSIAMSAMFSSTLVPSSDDKEYPIRYENLAHLEAIALDIRAFQAFHLAFVVPQSNAQPLGLRRISITLSCSLGGFFDKDKITRAIKGVDIESVDTYFSHPAFDIVRCINITVRVKENEPPAGYYMRHINGTHPENVIEYCQLMAARAPLTMQKKPESKISVEFVSLV